MTGITGADGAVVFTMLPSFQYIMQFSGGSLSAPFQTILFPQQETYTIWIPGAAYVPAYASVAMNNSLPVYLLSGNTQANLSMSYNDTTGQTASVTFLVYTANGTLLYSEPHTGVQQATANYTVDNVWGEGYYYGFTATSIGGTVEPPLMKGITMKGPSGVMVDFGLTDGVMYEWIAFALIMLVGAMFTSERTQYFGGVLTPMTGLIMWWFGWVPSSAFLGICIFMVFFGALAYMKDSHRRHYGIGGPGSILMSILLYIFLLQAAVGLVNTLNFFPSQAGQFDPPVGAPYNSWNVTKAQIDFTPGGIYQEGTGIVVLDVLFSGVTLLISGLRALWMMLTGLFTISLLMFKLFHLQDTPALIALAGLIQLGFYILLGLAIFQWFFKPPLGSADL
jgi:hypothetical protein